ncbi:hypothetical protein [Croceivirga thetidis]|uniref:hypothetical protein n=1 Tax=Croceivirga thetidis TaxID=2721623 RepID=UPI001B2FF955|nr:hypothetical protein [Croceivirga thetidis]
MRKNTILASLLVFFLLIGCESETDENVNPAITMAGTISGGPFVFCVDGEPDMVDGITLDSSDSEGSLSTWIVTDDENNILGLPPTLEALGNVDFDEAGGGTCFIWYIRYEEGLSGLESGMNVDDLEGDFDLSNSIEVVRNETRAGTISGGPYEFTVDGQPDFVTELELDSSEALGTNSTWVITDDALNILGLPPTLDDVKNVDFDGAGAGVCLIWYLRFEDGLVGAEMGANAADLEGCFSLSNSIEVTRLNAANAGEISGGPFSFCVDGEADFVSDINLNADNASGSNSSWVVTDDQGVILGLPPNLDALYGVNFDDAGPGLCLIWYLRYEDGITGLEPGMNANELQGNFALSNALEVQRNQPEAGEITGGPYTFYVDGTPDFVTDISLKNESASGTNSTWVITDDQLNILGLPPTLDAVKGVDFDSAGAGVCLIWYLRYEDGLTGLEAGQNAGNLEGCFDLSNSIEVTRKQGANAGTISGGPFDFCVDGEADHVSGITLDATNAAGSNSTWVITDDQGIILGLPPTLEAVEGVNFDAAGPGVCLIWYLRYEDGLSGLEAGMNANELEGNFDLSNAIEVTRNEPNAGEIIGGPYTFYVDGEADFVMDISLNSENASGTNSTWVITDDQLNILGLPPTLDAVKGVDFDAAGPGVCLIWYLRYEDGLTGLEPGMNAGHLEGCFNLSNSIQVTRNQGANAGVISGGPFEFCVDGYPDHVSGIHLDASNASGSNSTWVITDDQGNILGLPPTLDAVQGVDFDGAGGGVCLIWYMRFNGELQGAEVGMNAANIQGNFDLSNSIEVVRNAPNAGAITGGPYTFNVDGNPDFVMDVALDGSEVSGTNSSWIITDDRGVILGAPPTLDALKAVDFDAAGPGTCFIYYIRYEDGFRGLEPGWTFDEFVGCFDISNSIEVNRIH